MGMVSQGVLPFQVEAERSQAGTTGLAGLSSYLDLAHVAGLAASVERHVRLRARSQGYTDAQMVTALIMLNLAGGECVDDLRWLAGDEGFSRLLGRVEWHGRSRRERRELGRRFRRERVAIVPSPTAVFRYLAGFHDEDEETRRTPGAFIPKRNASLAGLSRVNADLLSFVQRRSVQRVATMDQDATVMSTQKASALWSYKDCWAYQPQNVWWSEQSARNTPTRTRCTVHMARDTPRLARAASRSVAAPHSLSGSSGIRYDRGPDWWLDLRRPRFPFRSNPHDTHSRRQ